MITCAGDKEKRSVKDCFNILNEALEKTHQSLDVQGIMDKHNEAQRVEKEKRDNERKEREIEKEKEKQAQKENNADDKDLPK